MDGSTEQDEGTTDEAVSLVRPKSHAMPFSAEEADEFLKENTKFEFENE